MVCDESGVRTLIEVQWPDTEWAGDEKRERCAKMSREPTAMPHREPSKVDHCLACCCGCISRSAWEGRFRRDEEGGTCYEYNADTDDDSSTSSSAGAHDLPPAWCTRICHPVNVVVNTSK